jgi:hypothetical protein
LVAEAQEVIKQQQRLLVLVVLVVVAHIALLQREQELLALHDKAMTAVLVLILEPLLVEAEVALVARE